MIRLSKRLAAIASLVTQGNILADIGCDHGYLPIYLIQQQRIPRAIAMDIRSGPLSRARQNIEAYGLLDYIEVRLSDGLEALDPAEAQTVVAAGMGGPLMEEILKRGAGLLASVQELVLQPQSEVEHFRRFLRKLPFTVTKEELVEEDGKYYTVLAAGPGAMHYDEEFRYQYGDLLIRKKMPVLWEYLKKEERQLQNIQKQLQMQAGQASLKRLEEIEERLGYVKGAFNAMQGID